MGVSLFLLVPFVAGFSIALIARKPKSSVVAASLLSVIASLVLLIALGREGVLCAILAFPIIVVGLVVGTIIGFLVRKLFIKRDWSQPTTMGIVLLIAPTVILAGERIERPMLLRPRTEVVQTTVEVNDPPEKVWARILAIDTVQANKPILMYIGLPIPQRCTMQGRGLGAKRTCYFNVGYIEETVTAWNPPYYLGLSVDRTHMPGRHWLGFESAEYRLQPNGPNTRLTRTTTVSSDLHPSWYCRRFERLGVESEHNYILHDIMLRSAH
jgi:MFS family permease